MLMQRPVQITFHNLTPSPAVEEVVAERAAWLETFHAGIIGCRVTLEVPHRHSRQGRAVHVRIELSLPGEDVVVRHAGAAARPGSEVDDPARHRARSDKNAKLAVHDAFDIARRRLEDVGRRRRGAVKSRAGATRAAGS
jgi:hypothetical protein